MKTLTDFCKTVETGVDPRLSFCIMDVSSYVVKVFFRSN